jgi:hypothetical protein
MQEQANRTGMPPIQMSQQSLVTYLLFIKIGDKLVTNSVNEKWRHSGGWLAGKIDVM